MEIRNRPPKLRGLKDFNTEYYLLIVLLSHPKTKPSSVFYSKLLVNYIIPIRIIFERNTVGTGRDLSLQLSSQKFTQNKN